MVGLVVYLEVICVWFEMCEIARVCEVRWVVVGPCEVAASSEAAVCMSVCAHGSRWEVRPVERSGAWERGRVGSCVL